MKFYFSDSERADCSRLGKRGKSGAMPKPALDPRRVEIIQGKITINVDLLFQTFGVLILFVKESLKRNSITLLILFVRYCFCYVNL